MTGHNPRKLIITLLVFFLFLWSHSALAAIAPLNFTVNTSEVVIVDTAGGIPSIVIDVGGVSRTAIYSSGSNSNALLFSYTPVVGDVDLDGISVSSPIVLNGGTIRDAAGNNATLTFTPPDTTNVKINYPSLSMDFVADADGRYTLNGNAYHDLPAFLTATGGSFTRNSIATYFDSSGTLQTATANTPRFDHDPVTNAAKGILIEEARTNLLLRSSEFENGVWGKAQCTANANATLSPDNTLSADSIVANALAVNFQASQNLTLPNNTTTFSVYVKAGSVQHIRLRYINFDANPIAEFNLTTGTISAGDSSAFINNAGNNFWRIGLSKPTGADLAGTITISPLEGPGDPTFSSTPSGDMFYIWGAQLEAGSFPTSFIPTTTAAVTRAEDNVTLPVGGWYNNATGTVFGDYTPMGVGSSTVASIYYFYGSSYSNNVATTRLRNTGDLYSTFLNSSNITYIPSLVGATGIVTGTRIKVAQTIKSGDYAISVNGGGIATNAAIDVPFPTSVDIGGRGANGNQKPNGSLRTFKYYPVRVSNTPLQLMTQ